MNVIITSEPHVGKTTVVEKMMALLQKNNVPVGGILCKRHTIKEIGGKSQRFYYLGEMNNCEKVGHCYILNSAIEFGEQAIKNTWDQEGYIIIDEYGSLELRGKGFHGVTEESLKLERCIILVRKILLKRFVEKFPYKFLIFEVTKENRNQMPKIICKCLCKKEDKS